MGFHFIISIFFMLQNQHLLFNWLIYPRWTNSLLHWHFQKQHQTLQFNWMQCTVGKQRYQTMWRPSRDVLRVRGSSQPGSVFKHWRNFKGVISSHNTEPNWHFSRNDLPHCEKSESGILEHGTRTNKINIFCVNWTKIQICLWLSTRWPQHFVCN